MCFWAVAASILIFLRSPDFCLFGLKNRLILESWNGRIHSTHFFCAYLKLFFYRVRVVIKTKGDLMIIYFFMVFTSVLFKLYYRNRLQMLFSLILLKIMLRCISYHLHINITFKSESTLKVIILRLFFFHDYHIVCSSSKLKKSWFRCKIKDVIYYNKCFGLYLKFVGIKYSGTKDFTLIQR